MEIVLLVLKIIAIALAALVAVLLILLFIPVSVVISYEQRVLRIYIRILFIKIRVFPQKPKKSSTTEEKIEKAEEQTAEVVEKAKKLNWRELLEPAKGIIGYVIRRIRVTIAVRIVVSGDDAAAIGRNTGAIWAVLGVGMALLGQIFRMKYSELNVIPDFDGKSEGLTKIDCKATTFPVIMVIAGIKYFVRYLKLRAKE